MLNSVIPAASLALAVFPLATLAQNSSYVLGLAQALNDQGLSTLATLAAGVLNDTAGPAFFEELQSGNKTLFAPSNDACASSISSRSSCALAEALISNGLCS